MTIPGLHARCSHTHLNGRECGRRIRPARDFCGAHSQSNVDGTTICAECAGMLELFPIRKTLREQAGGKL